MTENNAGPYYAEVDGMQTRTTDSARTYSQQQFPLAGSGFGDFTDTQALVLANDDGSHGIAHYLSLSFLAPPNHADAQQSIAWQ
jgi:hypothetical protein